MLKTDELDDVKSFFVGKEVGVQLSIVKRENEENLRFALLTGITEGTFVCTQEQLGQLPLRRRRIGVLMSQLRQFDWSPCFL